MNTRHLTPIKMQCYNEALQIPENLRLQEENLAWPLDIV